MYEMKICLLFSIVDCLFKGLVSYDYWLSSLGGCCLRRVRFYLTLKGEGRLHFSAPGRSTDTHLLLTHLSVCPLCLWSLYSGCSGLVFMRYRERWAIYVLSNSELPVPPSLEEYLRWNSFFLFCSWQNYFLWDIYNFYDTKFQLSCQIKFCMRPKTFQSGRVFLYIISSCSLRCQ